MNAGRLSLIFLILACTAYTVAAGYLCHKLAVSAGGENLSGVEALPVYEHRGLSWIVGGLAFPALNLPLLILGKPFRRWIGRSPFPVIVWVFGLLCIPYYFGMIYVFGIG